MPVHGTPRVQTGERKPRGEPPQEDPADGCALFFEPGIEAVAPEIETYEEEAHDLEGPVSVYEFLHPDQSPLDQEPEHLAVAVRVPQPVCEIVLRYPVPGALLLLGRHDPCGRGYTCQADNQIYSHREDEQYGGRAEQAAVRNIAEKRQEKPQESIQHQDVPAPDEHQVDETYEQEDGHPAIEDAETVCPLACRIGYYDGEPYPEKQGEKGVELPVDEQVLDISGHIVRLCGRHGPDSLGPEEGIKGEFREIGKADPEQGEPAQGVEYDVSFTGFHRGPFGVMMVSSHIIRLCQSIVPYFPGLIESISSLLLKQLTIFKIPALIHIVYPVLSQKTESLIIHSS